MSFYDNLVCRSFRNFNFSNKTFFLQKCRRKQCNVGYAVVQCLKKTSYYLYLLENIYYLKNQTFVFFFFQTLLPKMLRNIDERLRRPSQSFYMKELFLALGLKFPFWKILWPKKLLNMYVICRMLKKVCVDKRSLSH